jgi:hypothetical protein
LDFFVGISLGTTFLVYAMAPVEMVTATELLNKTARKFTTGYIKPPPKDG